MPRTRTSSLFEDFAGYVEFFLLQDLLDADDHVTFYLPFTGFEASPLPATVDEYCAYRDASLAFVRERNTWTTGVAFERQQGHARLQVEQETSYRSFMQKRCIPLAVPVDLTCTTC